jgi:hypothetical protein
LCAIVAPGQVNAKERPTRRRLPGRFRVANSMAASRGGRHKHSRMKNGQCPKGGLCIKVKLKGPEYELVRNRVLTNYYVKVGLLQEELVALRQIGGRKRTPGEAMKVVLNTAFLHWDELAGRLAADERYAANEGFPSLELYRRDRIAQAFPKGNG